MSTYIVRHQISVQIEIETNTIIICQQNSNQGMDLLMPMNFGMRHWEYQSFLVLPTDPENAAQPGSTITAKKWAKGELYLEDAIDDDPDAVGTLRAYLQTQKGLWGLSANSSHCVENG